MEDGVCGEDERMSRDGGADGLKYAGLFTVSSGKRCEICLIEVRFAQLE